MARLMLLSFKSNAECEDFARAMLDSSVKRDVDLADMLLTGAVALESAVVEWVIGRPTRACECNVKAGTVKKRRGRTVGRTDGWTKGRTYGWWVHPAKGCGRVTRLVMERFVAYLTNGSYDLLPQIVGDPERQPNDYRRFHPDMERDNRVRI